MTQRDVPRKTAERLGLVKKGERVADVKPTHVTDDVQADLTDVDPAIVEKFREYIENNKRLQVVPVKPLPSIVDTKPAPAPPTLIPPTRKPVPMSPGLTAFILAPTIPEIVLNGSSFVFFLGQWQSILGDTKDLDELNKFAGESEMMDKIKKAFGDAVSF
jgi:hypothetical protein